MSETPTGQPNQEAPLAPGAGGNAEAELSAEADRDQLLYAKILAIGMYLGLGLLLITFAIYVLGFASPGIPIDELPGYWTLGAHEYLEAINHHHLHLDHLVTGWRWVGLLGYGDFMNFVGVAVLAAVTIICYAGIVPSLIRKRDWIFAAIAMAEIIVLVGAASGIVAVGH